LSSLGSSHTHSLTGSDGTTGFKDGQINIDLRMAAACGRSGRSTSKSGSLQSRTEVQQQQVMLHHNAPAALF